MRRPPQQEKPEAAGRNDDNVGHVPDHGANQEEQLPGDRRGDAREERVSVSRGAFVMGMAIQDHVEADDVVVVRRSAVVMVVNGQVEGHRPADRRRRNKREQRGHGHGSLKGAPHGASIPDESQPVKARVSPALSLRGVTAPGRVSWMKRAGRLSQS